MIKHDDPDVPQFTVDNNGQMQESPYAHAPYNFVRLAGAVVESTFPPDLGIYDSGLKTGFIEYEIKTLSPTYIRGLKTVEDFESLQDIEPGRMTPKQKEGIADFYSYDETIQDHKKVKPVIPGSSIRGMLQNIVEIISYSKIHDFEEVKIGDGATGSCLPAQNKEGRHNSDMIDYAEALFGWALDYKKKEKKQYRGRVSFSDAVLLPERCEDATHLYQNDAQPVAPKILSNPKPSWYPHYLVQNKSKQHDPNDPQSLATYSSEEGETEIRGHKLYWAQGSSCDYQKHGQITPAKEKMYTRIIPLNQGVCFKSTIRFENLREDELGALLWALELPFDEWEVRHRIGMGKPLGMGVIAIENIRLFTIDLQKRYQNLVAENTKWWEEGIQEIHDFTAFIERFERSILRQAFPDQLARMEDDRREEVLRLSNAARIREMLMMMKWENKPNAAWRDEYTYMRLNEFREEKVLPTPSGVITRVERRKSIPKN